MDFACVYTFCDKEKEKLKKVLKNYTDVVRVKSLMKCGIIEALVLVSDLQILWCAGILKVFQSPKSAAKLNFWSKPNFVRYFHVNM